MKKIMASGFETVDGCLHRHQLNVSLEDVLQLESNRHLATLPFEQNRHLAVLPAILPARSKIYLPQDKPVVKETVSLWN